MIDAAAPFAWEQLAGARRGAQGLAEGTIRQFQRRVRGRTDVQMQSASIDVDGLRLNYAVSNNDDGPDQVWAVNIHGYFAGGAMYHRESEHLAESLGWRVVNPSLPGFGGSDPLSWSQISRQAYDLLNIVDGQRLDGVPFPEMAFPNATDWARRWVPFIMMKRRKA